MLNILYYLFLINNKVSESSTTHCICFLSAITTPSLPPPLFPMLLTCWRVVFLDKKTLKIQNKFKWNEKYLKSYFYQKSRDSYYVQKVPEEFGIVVQSLVSSVFCCIWIEHNFVRTALKELQQFRSWMETLYNMSETGDFSREYSEHC